MKWFGVMMSLALAACGDAQSSGEMTVRLAERSAATVVPIECVESGSPRGAGVELWDEAGWSFHFQHDSLTGPSLQVSTPQGEDVATIVPDDCQLFRGELRQRTEHEDEIAHVTYGHLDLDCQRIDGVWVYGELDFDHCPER